MSSARLAAAIIALTSALGGCAAVLSLDSGEPRNESSEAGADVVLPPPPDAGDDRVTGDDGGNCAAGGKICSGACAAADDPALGCAAPGCDPCAMRNAQATQVQDWQCAAGGCDIKACVINYKNCDLDAGDGCEVNGKTDPRHCGDCKTSCATADFCVDGTCQSTCTAPYLVCGDASCIPVESDPDNCGSCAHKCPPPSGGNATCIDGGCDFTCTNPYVRCDPYGCIDTSNNQAHCGSCTYDCAAHEPVNQMATGCVGGGCTFACRPGFVDGGGGTCVPPSGDGGCVLNAGGCTPGGSTCTGGASKCCGCACVSTTCCLEPGKVCMVANAGACCSGFCNPTVSADGGGGMGTCT